MKRSDLETARMHELLATRATQRLDDAERAELERFGPPSDELEVAAVMTDVVTLVAEPLPPALADKIFAAAVQRGSATAPSVPAVPAPTGAALAAVPRPSARPRVRARWVMASAAVAALAAAAVAIWLWRRAPADEATSPPAGRDDLAAERDAVRHAVTGDGVTGEVVWSGRRQRGVLRLDGLPANDATRERYQVWIFDHARDARYPVDGGLFDALERTTRVEIAPRVRVDAATGFLITREAPGGAVVSDRARVVAQTRAPALTSP